MTYLRSQPGLLSRFRDGDRDALEKVYRAYLPRVDVCLRRGFVVRSSGVRVPGVANPDDLAEAVQEVFTRAFRDEARKTYDGLRDYGPYLTTIARNLIVSRHRRAGRELLGVDLEALLVSDVDVPHEIDEAPWFDRRTLELTEGYVASLEEPMRAVHAVRYVQALSQRDAAQELGLSRPKLRKVEDKLRRGLLHLLNQAGMGGQQESLDTAERQQPWTNRQRTN